MPKSMTGSSNVNININFPQDVYCETVTCRDVVYDGNTSLKTTVQNLQTTDTNLQSEITTLQSSVGGNSSTITTLQSQVSSLQTSTSSLQTGVTNINNYIQTALDYVVIPDGWTMLDSFSNHVFSSLQACLNYLITNNITSSRVNLLASSYNVSNTTDLTFTGLYGCHIIARNVSAKVFVNNYNITFDTCNNITFENVAFFSNSGTEKEIDFINSSLIQFRNCSFICNPTTVNSSTLLNDLSFDGSCGNILIQYCRFERWNMYVAGVVWNFKIVDCNCNIAGYYTNTHWFHFHGNIPNSVSTIFIKDNVFTSYTDSTSTFIPFYIDNETNCRLELSVDNNVFDCGFNNTLVYGSLFYWEHKLQTLNANSSTYAHTQDFSFTNNNVMWAFFSSLFYDGAGLSNLGDSGCFHGNYTITGNFFFTEGFKLFNTNVKEGSITPVCYLKCFGNTGLSDFSQILSTYSGSVNLTTFNQHSYGLSLEKPNIKMNTQYEDASIQFVNNSGTVLHSIAGNSSGITNNGNTTINGDLNVSGNFTVSGSSSGSGGASYPFFKFTGNDVRFGRMVFSCNQATYSYATALIAWFYPFTNEGDSYRLYSAAGKILPSTFSSYDAGVNRVQAIGGSYFNFTRSDATPVTLPQFTYVNFLECRLMNTKADSTLWVRAGNQDKEISAVYPALYGNNGYGINISFTTAMITQNTGTLYIEIIYLYCT